MNSSRRGKNRTTWGRRSSLVCVVLLLGLSASALADDNKPPLSDKNPVRATLVASVETAALNEELQVGVLLEMAPKWHVYWTSPGNTGTPTRVRFTADTKYASVEPPRFPVPEIFDAKDLEFLSFGYHGSVLITASGMVSEPPPGKTRFTAKVSWLACKKSCVNGSATLSLDLAVGDKVKASKHAARFSALADKLPEPADAERAWLESMTYDKGKYELKIRLVGLKEAKSFIPSLPTGGVCTIEAYGVERRPKGQLVATLRFAGDACMPGVGGLVMGRASDAKAGSPLKPFLVEAAPPDTEAETEPGPTVAPAPKKAPTTKPAGTPAAGGDTPAVEREALWLMLIFAFLGGLLLNVMPCVIPVVVPKMLSVVRTAQKASDGERRRVLWSNSLAYTAGVVATMLSLGVTVVALKAVGREVGWGFQFQNPWFLAFMISLLLVLGLGLLHVYPLKSPSHQDQLKNLKKKRRKKPRWESFLTGLLVTFLGTPCTAPMLGPALGYAFTASTVEILLLMFMVGLGLSAPFLLLGAWTGWTKILPTRVSDRYDKVMRGMAFLLFGTGVWLLGVMASAYGADAAMNLVWFLLALGLGCWLYGLLTRDEDSWGKRLTRLVPLMAAVLVFGWWMMEFPEAGATPGGAAAGKVHLIKWVPFTEKRVAKLQSEGKTVFIDFTADWCMNCKANERLVIEIASTKKLMDELGVVPVKADNTRHDPVIQKWLKRYNRAGVPMYIVLPPCGDFKGARALPEILTESVLHEALKKAGPSRASCK